MATSTTNSGTVAATRQLADAFSAFGPLYKRWLHARIESKLGFTHQRALDVLASHGSMIMASLGAELGVTPRYVTSLVDGLEALGHVRRRPHPDDRRAIIVELTEQGETTCAAAGDVFTEINAELLSVLTPEQQHSLLQCLQVLLAELQRQEIGPDRHAEPPSAA
ncbi:MAG: MarR family winged helix-turn-helix transcriptional regulator [Gaiellaceae bacterium]